MSNTIKFPSFFQNSCNILETIAGNLNVENISLEEEAARHRVVQLCKEIVESYNKNKNQSPTRITLVDNRGLTFIGKTNLYAPGQYITIEDAQCIIRWGTNEHLAQLTEGPMPDTRLGYKADVTILKKNIIASYLCGPGWD